jgi:hypothetical protein
LEGSRKRAAKKRSALPTAHRGTKSKSAGLKSLSERAANRHCLSRSELLRFLALSFFRTFTRVLLQVRTLAAMQTADNGQWA